MKNPYLLSSIMYNGWIIVVLVKKDRHIKCGRCFWDHVLESFMPKKKYIESLIMVSKVPICGVYLGQFQLWKRWEMERSQWDPRACKKSTSLDNLIPLSTSLKFSSFGKHFLFLFWIFIKWLATIQWILNLGLWHSITG